MDRDRQIELMTAASVRLNERVASWIDSDVVKSAIRANAAMMRDLKNPPPPRMACGR